ncbi:MAG TPA: hypothetical protein VLB09_01745 [Nitrospiria bacterium]|nr:hypothetical protein [Nitrospiria bacterium]
MLFRTIWKFFRPTSIKLLIFLFFVWLVFALGEYCDDVNMYIPTECPSPTYEFFTAMGNQAYLVYYLVTCLITFFFRFLMNTHD